MPSKAKLLEGCWIHLSFQLKDISGNPGEGFILTFRSDVSNLHAVCVVSADDLKSVVYQADLVRLLKQKLETALTSD